MRAAFSPLALLASILASCSPASNEPKGPGGTHPGNPGTPTAAASGGGEVVVAGDGLVLLPSETPEDGPPSEQGLERAYFHSFGRVRYGEVVAHTFRLRNTDSRDLAIQSIKPGCGCTVPSVRYQGLDGSYVNGHVKPEGGEPMISVPPGAIAEVSLQIDTKMVATKNSDKTVQTTITTDSPNGFYVKLETHIVVEVPFHLVPNGINFHRVPISAGGRGTMDIVVAPGYGLELVEITDLPDNVTAELQRKMQPGQPAWSLVATLHGPLDEGRWNGEIRISTRTLDGEPAEPVVVPLQADAGSDLVSSPGRLVFVANDEVTRAEVVLSSLLMGHRYVIRSAAVDEGHRDLLEFEFEPESGDTRGASGTWIVRMWAAQPASVTELITGKLRLELDDPQHPEVLLPYVVHPGGRK